MIDRTERRWIWGFALAVIVLTSLPYVLGYFWQNAQWRYSGHLFGVEDGHSYVAQMLLGARGDWLFRSPYTEMDQRGALVLLPYLLLGKLSAPPGQYEQLLSLFHALRIGGVLGSVWAAYALAAVWITRVQLRRFATVLITLGGGLGVVRLVSGQTGQLPLELYSPEAFGFLMLLGIPHLAVARALLLWGLRMFWQPALHGSGWRAWLAAGLPWLMAWIFQPLPVIAGCGALGMYLLLWAAWLLWQRRSLPVDWQPWRAALLRAVQVALFAALLVLLTTAIFRLDPALRIWEERNRLLSPPVSEYLLSYALVLPFAGWGAWRLWREKPSMVLFCAGWVIGGLLWIHIPVTVQRRLIDGAWVALVLLAVAGLETVPSRWRWASRLLSLSFVAPLLFFVATTAMLRQPGLPLYQPAAAVEVYQYLDQHALKGAVVLANADLSSALPANAPLRVLVGHGPLMLDGAHVEQQVLAFFAGDMTSTQQRDFLRQHRVDFVIVEESAGFAQSKSSSAPYLSLQFVDGPYALYAVTIEEIDGR